MIVDVSDINSIARGYITNVLKEKYPLIDTSPNSLYDDMFIKPMIDVIMPLIIKIDRLEMIRNLSNAEYMTDEELDEIGEGNYFTPRKDGNYATTYVSLMFANLNIEEENFELIVPAGVVFQTSKGLQFQTKVDGVFTADDMRKGYDKVKMVYEVQVIAEAMGIGADYNVFSGEIDRCATPFNSSLVGVTNKADVTDGSDKEDNVAFADRLKDFAISRHLGTEPGYQAFIRENFPEVEDLYVAGKDNPYMERDLLAVYNRETAEVYDKHIGGMVDIYIKGFLLENTIATLPCGSGTVILPVEYDDLEFKGSEIMNNFEIYNTTDETKNPSILSVSKVAVSDYSGEYTGQTKIIIDNTGDISYDSTGVSSMKITYKHISNSISRIDEIYIDVGVTESDLSSPLKSIISIKAEGLDNSYSTAITHELEISGIKGTTKEKVRIKLSGVDDIPNSKNILVTYSLNETLRQMSEVFEYEEYRIITTDILAREAEQVPVNVQFRLKTESDKLDENTKAKIQSSIVSFFDAYNLGDQVEESDLVAWMYSDINIKNEIQYIALPFDVFYIPNSPSEDIPYDDKATIQPPDGVLPIKAIEYPTLNSSKFSVSTV